MVFLHPAGWRERLFGVVWRPDGGYVGRFEWRMELCGGLLRYFLSSMRKVVPLPTSELRT